MLAELKKTAAFLLVLAVIFSLFSMPVSAEEGNCGANLKWTLADGVLKSAVAIDHALDILTRGGAHGGGQRVNKLAAVAREELHLVLGGLVGAEQAVFFVIAAAVDACGEKIIQREDLLRTRFGKTALCA